MGMNTWFAFGNSSASEDESLPSIYTLQMKLKDFVDTDVMNIYAKILTDVIERCHGITEDIEPLLWDNCLADNSSDGLITLLSWAMTNKEELFLVYEKAVKVIREADEKEKIQIKADYEAKGESKTGFFISFKNFDKSDMIKLYSGLEYLTIAGMNKSSNLSNAIQIKMSDLRASVSLSDSAAAKAQAKVMAKALGEGKDILMDAKDVIETAKVDITSIEQTILFLNQKRAFYLGLPASYITGEQTGGLNATGEMDQKAVERGLKNYFFSIVKPVLESVFGLTITYKSQDFRQIAQALEALKTFDLTSENFLNQENKKKVIEGLLDIDEDDNEVVVVEEPPAFVEPIKGQTKPANSGPSGGPA